MMKPTFEWKKPLNNGRLKTPVHFLSNSYDGPEPSEDELSEVFSTYCEIYSSSMKDIEILNNVNAKFGMTIVIRNQSTAFIPTRDLQVKVDDYRYQNQTFNIYDIRPSDESYTIVLGVVGDD
ncbi:hypothetical protein [Enterococcus cecorum]|uniref:hypothetical protein n=1 Tax=Enterococcus cecorum TaxID=44008 RepID=UPI002492DAC5|nr:hypothetical protein [Enterococcus cecorum]